jgi:hypothetical protein
MWIGEVSIRQGDPGHSFNIADKEHNHCVFRYAKVPSVHFFKK